MSKSAPARRLFLRGGAALAASTLAGCGGPERLAALPSRLHVSAPYRGMPEDCRVILNGRDDALIGSIVRQAALREVAHLRRNGQPIGEASYLAISGGGEDGAFGAGLITAWTRAGTRPEFKTVTGVSTGALSAPFAFLGPRYDAQLERIYTQVTQADIMASRGLLTALLQDSAYDSAPLLRTIRGYVTPAFLEAIASEYRDKGRLLFIATTNLDVPIGVMWNMGAIAASGHPRAVELFASILLASASIPAVFPPVMIDIETDSGRFQEMHVDGGTVAQVVLYPPSLGADALSGQATPADRSLIQAIQRRSRKLFIIRNSRLAGEQQTVSRSTFKIAGRAISTLIQTQGIGDLYQLYMLSQRDRIDYNVSYIPARFEEKLSEPFEQGYMRKLFALGQEVMLTGKAWSKLPPGYNPTSFSLGPPGT